MTIQHINQHRLVLTLQSEEQQGFIQDFQFGGGGGGGDVVCGLTGMGEYFSQVTPKNGAKSIVVSIC